MARLVQALDVSQRVTVVPNQQPGLVERLGLTRADVDRSAWAQTPDGRLYAAAAAVNLTLGVMWRTRLPWRLYQLRPLRRLEDAAYRWVAANRHRFPGLTPYCQQHPPACGGEAAGTARATAGARPGGEPPG